MAEVKVLGSAEILRADQSPLSLQPRVRRLLIILATRANDVVSPDWLAEAVWGADAPQAADAALQTLMSRLRSALRGQAEDIEVQTEVGGYRLRLGREALDAQRFEDLLAQAGRAADNTSRAGLLDQALGLWRGPAYAEFAGEAFAEAEAARLNELRVVAQEDRAELQLDLGRPESAMPTLIALTRAHPFRERPHDLLMLAQYRAGRTAEALDTFRRFRQQLSDELGLDPSPVLVRRQAAILANDPSLDRHRPAPATSALIGRDADTRELIAALRAARLVTVVGPGGLGKTSLATAVVAMIADQYADGAVTFELAALSSGASVPAALCTALGVAVGSDQDPAGQLVALLQDREQLILLDNCEHLAGGVAGLVADLLRSCPRLTILATSRSALGLPIEQVFGLAPLPGQPAVQLFLTRARARVRGFDPDPDALRQIARLCTRLDGLPLAIELAAIRMDAMTPAELLERLPWRLTVLRGGAATDPRHRTLRALVDWSFDRLSAPERELFEIVSVFAGDFTLDDAEQVATGLEGDRRWDAAAVVTGLTGLVEQSMITRRPGGAAYALLETMRAYGRERLAARGLDAAVKRAHAEHYAAPSATPDHLFGAGQAERVAQREASIDELRTAFWWSFEHDPGLAAELVGGLGGLVEHKLIGEVTGWADQLLAREDPGRSPSPRWSRVCAVAAAGAVFSGDLPHAEHLAERAAALAGADVTARATALYLLGEVAFFNGRLTEVAGLRDQVADLAARDHRLDPLLAMMEAESLLARGYLGDATAAIEARELQIMAERRGWPMVAAWAVYVRGELAPDHDGARGDALLQEAVARARALDDRYLIGVALVSAAASSARHGNAGLALQLFGEVVRHWRERGDWTHQWTTLRNVLDLLIRLGRREPAVVLAAALLDPDRPATGYGADARRLIENADALARVLDPDRHAELTAYGRTLSDQRLVSFVLRALEESALQSVEPEEAEVLDR
ncbi:MAG TPA: BTAD domain-containing putative transcriptional regulator [Propionibacteriaceae bacterium]|nr:BTAD domain-containing putative transcriptional regulator [Propionibacteriaceae bacterium]